jgi:hypothetical protein
MTFYWNTFTASDITKAEFITPSEDTVRIWLADGNTCGFNTYDERFKRVEEWGGVIASYVDPAPAPPAPPAPLTPAEKLKAAGLTVEELKALLAG